MLDMGPNFYWPVIRKPVVTPILGRITKEYKHD